MRKQFRAIFALLMAAILLLCQLPAFAQAAQQDPPPAGSGTEPAHDSDTVADEDALADWLYAHEYTGGTVTLGGDITVTYQMTPYTDETAPITIDTGAFGLIFDGGCVTNSCGFLFITGEGVDKPVVDVLDMGWFRMGNWNNHLQRMNIAATGNGETGGTALRISGEDGSRADLSLIYEEGQIRSFGAGAVGIELAAPADLYCFRVEVEGENSAAVSAPSGGSLFYSKLTATGAGAVLASGADILLDTCATSGEAGDARVIGRTILESSGGRLYLPLRLNHSPNTYDLTLFSTPAFYLSGDEGSHVKTELIGVWWDEDAYLALDTGVLGKTTVSGTFDAPLQGLGLLDDFSLALTVEVRAPDLPCIERLAFGEDERGKYAALYFWEAYDRADESLVLWRSDNGGETWADVTDSADMEWEGDSLRFYYEELENPVMLQLEITGKGESNVVTIYEKDGVSFGSPGGDRTGTDRGGADTGNASSLGNAQGDGDDHGEASTPGGEHNPDNGRMPDGGEDTPDGAIVPDGAGSSDNGSASEEGSSPGGESILPSEEGIPGGASAPDATGNPDDGSVPDGGSHPDSEPLRGNDSEPGVGVQLDAPTHVTVGTLASQTTERSSPEGNTPARVEPEGFAQTERTEANAQLPPGGEAAFLPVVFSAAAPPDSGQSAPAPAFNADAAILLSLCAAALFFGALFWTRLRLARR